MAHTHTLLWSSSFNVRQASLHIFLLFSSAQGLALQDDVHGVMFFLPFAFTYLLVGADLIESGPR